MKTVLAGMSVHEAQAAVMAGFARHLLSVRKLPPPTYKDFHPGHYAGVKRKPDEPKRGPIGEKTLWLRANPGKTERDYIRQYHKQWRGLHGP